MSPFHSDGLLMSNVAVAGLLVVLFSCFDMKGTILGRHHYLLFYSALAMMPSMLMLFDEDLGQITTPVRVGDAVDTVALAGKPKTITGFNTHDSPVIIGANKVRPCARGGCAVVCVVVWRGVRVGLRKCVVTSLLDPMTPVVDAHRSLAA